MHKHDFIFKEGIWIGEGKVRFSTSPEEIHFYTKWTLNKMDNESINCRQQVEMRGGGDEVSNFFHFSNITDTDFSITIENDILGRATGKGVIDEKSIAWEFLKQLDFEGFESYERQEDGDYLLHAEYVSTDQHRTIIEGRIWKKL